MTIIRIALHLIVPKPLKKFCEELCKEIISSSKSL